MTIIAPPGAARSGTMEPMRASWAIVLIGCHFSHGESFDATAPVDLASPDMPVASTCTDGVQDGDETGVDCGGSCPACQAGCTSHELPPSLNVDATQWSASFLASPRWDCSGAGTTTIDSQSGLVTATNCDVGTIDVTDDVAQIGGGPNVMVVRLRGLSITGGYTLQLTGDKPIIILVAGDVVVDGGGLIDAGARAGVPGPGGSSPACADKATGLGEVATVDGWGGGGGGFGTAGGQGGYNVVNGGLASGTLTPLRGGCAGGTGNTTPGMGQLAGAGGGAVELSASGTIAIGATSAANIAASGGGAPAFTGGGNGGGAGGAVLLVSPVAATFGAGSALRANGGSGSSGSSSGSNLAGGDGHVADNAPATDSSGTPGGGNGNDHGRAGGIATWDASGLASVAGQLPTQQVGGRGGGGGGGGMLEVTTGTDTAACD